MRNITLLILLTTLAACQTTQPPTPPPATATHAAPAPTKILNGVDILQRDNFRLLENQRVAIVTNHTGLTRDGQHIVDLLHHAPNVNLVKIFSPEHGLYGKLDEKVGHSVHPEYDLKVYSLYGETRKPTPDMLEDIDTIVFDIQDIGTRFYTYISTMGLCMEAASEHNLRIVVLDRPNPINGVDVAGPIADEKYFGFTAYGPLPLRHGMTVGELANLFNTEYDINANLTVVPVEGWSREQFFDHTNLLWTNPSPNMRNLTQAILYPGIGLLESGKQISVGRGTDQPFEFFGAPFINPQQLAAALNKQNIPGLSFVPIRFTPTVRHYKDQDCGGIYVMITDRHALEPISAGMTIAWTIEHLYPDAYDLDSVARMIQDDDAMNALKSATDPTTIPNIWQAELNTFKQTRLHHLIY
ncbi:MAG: DUF1343 domain-containing protein [Phycisphaeraceae bacterium]